MSDVLFYGCQNRNQALGVSPGRSSTIFYHLHITRYQAQEQVEDVQRLILLPCSGSESAGGAAGRVRFRRIGQCPHGQNVLPLKKAEQEAAAQRRPARSEREDNEKTAFFSQNDWAYGLKLQAFHTQNA